MRIPDYRFTAPIKDQNYITPKKRRVEKNREEEFGKELEEALYQKESESKKKNVLPPRFVGNRFTSWG